MGRGSRQGPLRGAGARTSAPHKVVLVVAPDFDPMKAVALDGNLRGKIIVEVAPIRDGTVERALLRGGALLEDAARMRGALWKQFVLPRGLV